VGDKNGSKVAQDVPRLGAWKELIMGQNSRMGESKMLNVVMSMEFKTDYVAIIK
jgi:hypothetical protein